MRRYNGKKLLRLMFACLCAASVSLILLLVIRGYRIPQAEGEYMEINTAKILLDELELGELYKADPAQEQQGSQEEKILTYAQYLHILHTIHDRRPTVYTKQDMERDSKQALSASYLGRHKMLKADFMKVYFALAQRLVPDKNIREQTYLILGLPTEVRDVTQQGILAADVASGTIGGAELIRIQFDDYERYLYQSVAAIMSLDRVVLIQYAKSEKFTMERAWIESNTQEGLFVRYRDKIFRFPYQKEIFDDFEKIADVTIADGKPSEVKVYRDVISGKLLGFTDSEIELEGQILPYARDLQVYKLYGEKEPYTLSDLKIGYAFTDFVIDGGTVIAALATCEENMDSIRVLIKSSDYASDYHEKVILTPDCDVSVRFGDEEKKYKAGKTLTFTPESKEFDKGRVTIEPENLTGKIRIDNLKRTQGAPEYAGSLELTEHGDGIVIVNELPLEEYLYAVLPSEMPPTYPAEALKAQAVSARTYAYKNMQKSGLPALGAHVDDSTSYQVYNNIGRNERTTLAVRETAGMVITYQGRLADTFYYSTSCGYSTDLSAWGDNAGETAGYLKARHLSDTTDPEEDMREEEAFHRMITSTDPDDFEKDFEYYRWSYVTKMDTELL
ncbi:MAG: SpoIID/LytB domain-containing protein, partial [Lachnospiraceae bacterium]|nr:SpoIID/LytB domain-containing protein [Lachnospiraceae bacterium]